MRVLLISPNRLRLIVPPLPLGLASVVGAVKSEHPCRVVDFMFEPEPQQRLLPLIKDFQPEIIALGLRNVDNQDSRNPVLFFPETKELLDWLRLHYQGPIALGGGAFNILPVEFMDYLGADFGIVGDGELSFQALLQAYPKGEFSRVPGLIWRHRGQWQCNAPRPVLDLDRLPDPALEYFTPIQYHEAVGSAKLAGMITLQSRRGCPMNCIYCTTPLIEGRRLRARSPKKVAALMAYCYERWHLTRFYFIDNIFNYPLDYACQLCQAVKDLNLPVQWSCIINPAFPDAELFHLIREAGGRRMQVGNESGSDLVLTNLGKGFGRDQVEKTLQLLGQAGLAYSCFLLFGGPGETSETVKESVALLEKYQPQMVNLTVGIRIYPGSRLYWQALAEGVISKADNLLWPRFYLSPAIADWIWDYLPEVTARHPNWSF
ncbi:MAG: B12-binding domain-containing radical SAM protein [Desulfobacteraceae bacterium]